MDQSNQVFFFFFKNLRISNEVVVHRNPIDTLIREIDTIDTNPKLEVQ